MKIITQLVILTLSLLLVNAHDDINHYSTHPFTVPIRSCCDLRIFPPDRVPTGVYKISMGTFDTANVYCNMTIDGGRWTVIQRNRKNSQLSFDKNWREYKEGFDDLNKDFWAGLKLIHTLTETGQWEIRVDHQRHDKRWSYLHYNNFSVGSPSAEYPLTIGGFTGIGNNLFKSTYYSQNGLKFYTGGTSGWWYKSGYSINPNARPPFVSGNVLFAEVKIRPKDCITQ